MKKMFSFILFALVVGLLSGCDHPPSADQVQRVQQEELNKQGNSVAGMPAIINFREKKILKMIYEMRDKELSTITYIQDNQGRMRKLCDSVGFGIPYATQYTNPQRYIENARGVLALPQADPNGLFSPASAEGTWVLCANPETKGVSPVFVEPRVVVSPFALPEQK